MQLKAQLQWLAIKKLYYDAHRDKKICYHDISRLTGIAVSSIRCGLPFVIERFRAFYFTNGGHRNAIG